MEKGDFCISTMASSNIAVLLTIGVITVLVIRMIYVINRSRKPLHSKSPRSLSTLIVLGSGGHTAEMLNLLYVLQTERFKPRYYIAAATDNMSLQKAHVFEDSLLGKILCNGPGTCIPLCVIAFLFKVLGIRWSSIFYVESIARVRKLSLSGLLLYKLHMADQLFVQWPQLKEKYPRAHYVGRLM
uniref:UDP-N-acetylglucosamine transferase subunit ALG14 n=1 Tax=Solanum tuberosum TaxID=4113 RepID=M1B1H6_SOLTU